MSKKSSKHFGLSHDTLGNARLIDFDAKSLIVSNIGRTGYDGVSIGLDDIDFWEGSFSFAPMERRQADSSVVISVIGDTSKARKVHLFSVRYYLGGDSLVASVDNSGLEPNQQTVQMLRGKTVVNEVLLTDSAFAIDLPPLEVVKSSFEGGCKFEFWKRNRKVQQSFRFRHALPISVAGSETVEVDRLNLIPHYTSFDTERFLRLEARAINVRAILIFDEVTQMPEDW
jgi:hypothetical protein